MAKKKETNKMKGAGRRKPRAKSSEKKNHLLVIAIDNYVHHPKLNNAVRDAQAFIDVLCERYKFEIENVIFLKDEEATREQIRAKLLHLVKTLKEDDNLILYFSGHGDRHEGLGSYWLPVEAKKNDFNSYMECDSIINFIKGMKECFHVLLIADFCFSGYVVKTRSASAKSRIETVRSRWVMTSSDEDEEADDGLTGGHSPFATAMLEVLRNADTTTSVTMLYAKATESLSNSISRPLLGYLRGSNHEGGEFVFHLRDSATTKAGNKADLKEPPTIQDEQPDEGATDENEPLWREKHYKKGLDLKWRILTVIIGMIFLIFVLSYCLRKSPGIDIFSSSMVYVEGGSFMMGCQNSDANCHNDEEPTHKQKLRGFYIGKYEVTQKQWFAIMGDYPQGLENKGCDECPVESVSWDEIHTFLSRLNEETQEEYRLPTEAEWEYAARGGKKSKNYIYPGGNEIEDVAWYCTEPRGCGENKQEKARRVGQKMPNELGLYDMSGNVYELCNDWYTEDYDTSPPQDSTRARVMRGGSYIKAKTKCRSTHRNKVPEGTGRLASLGFRLVRD